MGEAIEDFEYWQQLMERDPNYADAAWAGEVFDWDDVLVSRASDLLSKWS
ncbi:MAG: hypothetical protein AAF125_27730 [Chloroflexota bacterium]